ncbi:MAG: PilW family protein, partial [Desulfobacterales bacterium]
NLSDESGQLTTDLDTGLPLAVPVSLTNIRAVRIWILARTRAPVRSYLDDQTYAVGDRSISCSDKYRRRLTRATVYCRNTRL